MQALQIDVSFPFGKSSQNQETYDRGKDKVLEPSFLT